MDGFKIGFKALCGAVVLAIATILGFGGSEIGAAALLDETKIMASDAQMDDTFGGAVGISGNTAVVGSRGEDGGIGDPLPWAGAAYVFERNAGGPGNWGEVVKLSANDAQMDDFFGTAVAIDSDTIVVGATGEDGGTGDPLLETGAAYVFERNQGGSNNWGQVTKLTANDAQDDDNFGVSAAVSGDTIIVGANFEDGGTGNPLSFAGAAYIFERNQGGANNWGQVKKLSHGDAQSNDFFGQSLAIDGNTIVISSTGEDGGPGDPMSSAGAAYIFERNQGGANNWGQVKKLTASDAQPTDFFGWATIQGDTVVIGAPGEDGGPGDPISGAGAAYVFERDAGGANNWGEVVKLSASDAEMSDAFGPALGIYGDTIVIATDDEDGGPGDPLPESGAVYIFERNQGGPDNWGEVEIIRAGDAQDDDAFGHSVGIDGGTIIVGAWLEDGGPGDPLVNSGAAYIYRGELDMLVYLPVMIKP